MRIMLTTVLVSALALPACGSLRDSRINPMTWFGKSRVETVEAGPVNPLIPRKSRLARPEAVYQGVPVAQILDVRAERAAGGAILRVTALSATLGAYDVRLEPVEYDGEPPKGVLEFVLKAVYSQRSRPNAPASSREIVAGTFLTDEDLEAVRTIRVIGAENARSIRR